VGGQLPALPNRLRHQWMSAMGCQQWGVSNGASAMGCQQWGVGDGDVSVDCGGAWKTELSRGSGFGRIMHHGLSLGQAMTMVNHGHN